MTFEIIPVYFLIGFIIGLILLYVSMFVIMVLYTELSIKWQYRDMFRR